MFDQVRFCCEGYKNLRHFLFQVEEMGKVTKATKSVEKSPTRKTENGYVSKKVDKLAASNKKLSAGQFNETPKNPQRSEPTHHEIASLPVGVNIVEIFKFTDPHDAKGKEKLNYSRNSERRHQQRIPAKTANGRSRGQWLWAEEVPKDTKSSQVHVEEEQLSVNVSQ